MHFTKSSFSFLQEMLIISSFSLALITDNYHTIAKVLVDLAKLHGSRDNISVIVLYLKEPHLIATQSWPSTIQHQQISSRMDNVYESQPADTNVAPSAITNPMDALGNTNQVSVVFSFQAKGCLNADLLPIEKIWSN